MKTVWACGPVLGSGVKNWPALVLNPWARSNWFSLQVDSLYTLKISSKTVHNFLSHPVRAYTHRHTPTKLYILRCSRLPVQFQKKILRAVVWCFIYYAALLPRRGPHIASHSVCLSVCPSVPLSLPSVTSFRQPLASRMYFSARTEGIRSFRHGLRAAYRTAISAAQILVYGFFSSSTLC